MTPAQLAYFARTPLADTCGIELLQCAIIAAERDPCPWCYGSGIVHGADCTHCLGAGVIPARAPPTR
jgi:hypothetical protein